ncbi:MAG: hypothetical protein EXX96DRAFT_486749, partial [Benjaminiella poitrasii]
HIPGVDNTTADQLSRQRLPVHEQKILREWFHEIHQRWRGLRIKAFAARHNQVLPTYWSRISDPQAAAVDAFKQA